MAADDKPHTANDLLFQVDDLDEDMPPESVPPPRVEVAAAGARTAVRPPGRIVRADSTPVRGTHPTHN